MTWKELFNKMLDLGKSPEEIKQAILDGVPEGELSQEEANARVQQLESCVAEMQGSTVLAETESGSLYEFDLYGKRVRRLQGRINPTPRMGQEGEWKSYQSITPLLVGVQVMIQWPATTPLLPGSDGDVPTTLTSRVVALHREGKVMS